MKKNDKKNSIKDISDLKDKIKDSNRGLLNILNAGNSDDDHDETKTVNKENNNSLEKKPVEINQPSVNIPPRQPGQPTNNRPVNVAPRQPGQPINSRPVNAAPRQPGQPTNNRPVNVAPRQPGQLINNRPVNVAPRQPGQPTNNRPVNVAPRQPGQPTNNRPVNVAPRQPGQPTNNRPVNAPSIQPGSNVKVSYLPVSNKNAIKAYRPKNNNNYVRNNPYMQKNSRYYNEFMNNLKKDMLMHSQYSEYQKYEMFKKFNEAINMNNNSWHKKFESLNNINHSVVEKHIKSSNSKFYIFASLFSTFLFAFIFATSVGIEYFKNTTSKSQPSIPFSPKLFSNKIDLSKTSIFPSDLRVDNGASFKSYESVTGKKDITTKPLWTWYQVKTKIWDILKKESPLVTEDDFITNINSQIKGGQAGKYTISIEASENSHYLKGSRYIEVEVLPWSLENFAVSSAVKLPHNSDMNTRIGNWSTPNINNWKVVFNEGIRWYLNTLTAAKYNLFFEAADDYINIIPINPSPDATSLPNFSNRYNPLKFRVEARSTASNFLTGSVTQTCYFDPNDTSNNQYPPV